MSTPEPRTSTAVPKSSASPTEPTIESAAGRPTGKDGSPKRTGQERERLTVQATNRSGHAVVTVVGSIDIDTRPLLDQAMEDADPATATAILVDLTSATFCDSSGLNTFVRWHQRLSHTGRTLVVCALGGRVEQSFVITGLTRFLYRRADVDAALRWLDTGHVDDGLPAGP